MNIHLLSEYAMNIYSCFDYFFVVLKFVYSEKARKSKRYILLSFDFWHYWVMSYAKKYIFLKNFCRLLTIYEHYKKEFFVKFLWPSQKTWTLYREMFPIKLQCTCRRTAITRSKNSHAIEKERKAKKAVSRLCSLITLGGLSQKAIFYLWGRHFMPKSTVVLVVFGHIFYLSSPN